MGPPLLLKSIILFILAVSMAESNPINKQDFHVLRRFRRDISSNEDNGKDSISLDTRSNQNNRDKRAQIITVPPTTTESASTAPPTVSPSKPTTVPTTKAPTTTTTVAPTTTTAAPTVAPTTTSTTVTESTTSTTEAPTSLSSTTETTSTTTDPEGGTGYNATSVPIDNDHHEQDSHGETTTSVNATTGSWSIHPAILALLVVVPVITIALVIAILLYRKKNKKKETDGFEISATASITQTPATMATTVTPVRSLATTDPAAPRSNSNSYRNPARSDNEHTSKEKLSSSETRVEMQSGRDEAAAANGNQSIPPGNIPVQQISAGPIQAQSRALMPNVAPPTSVNRLTPQTSSLTSDAASQVDGMDTGESSDLNAKTDEVFAKNPERSAEPVEPVKKPRKIKKTSKKVVNRKEINVQMVNYRGDWREVYQVGSDFSFSIESKDDPV